MTLVVVVVIVVPVIVIIVHRVHATITQNRKFLPETDLRDLDGGEKLRFLRPVEHIGQRRQDGVIVVGVGAELRNGLRDEHIEPI